MLGKAVLLECLENAEIKRVVLLNRRKLEFQHPKIEEVIVDDYEELKSLNSHSLKVDACFHCMGTTAVGKSKEQYEYLTYTLSSILIDALHKSNPEMVVQYVSGQGTDSSENGRVHWANVKGKTEKMILNKGFKDAYALRPGAILPMKGIKSSTRLYSFLYFILRPFFPLLKRMSSVITSADFAKGMIYLAMHPKEQKHWENKELKALVI